MNESNHLYGTRSGLHRKSVHKICTHRLTYWLVHLHRFLLPIHIIDLDQIQSQRRTIFCLANDSHSPLSSATMLPDPSTLALPQTRNFTSCSPPKTALSPRSVCVCCWVFFFLSDKCVFGLLLYSLLIVSFSLQN